MQYPEEKQQQQTIKIDPFFQSFKNKSVQNTYRKSEQCLGWNCNGQLIATAQNKIRLFKLDRTTYYFDIEKNEQKGHDSSTIDNLQWHPQNPDVLAYITKQPYLYIWDIRDRNVKKVNNIQSENLNVCYSQDGNIIALCNRDNKLQYYDVRKDDIIYQQTFEMDINELQWDPTGSIIIIAGSLNGAGTIRVQDGKNFTKNTNDLLDNIQSDCHSMKILTLAIDPKGKYFATGSSDTLIGLWDLDEIAMIQTYSQSETAIKKLSFSYDGQYLASLSGDKNILIYNCIQNNVASVIDKESPQNNLQWSPNQYILAYLGDDKVENEGNLRLYGQF